VQELLEYTGRRPRLPGGKFIGEIKREQRTEETRAAVWCTRGLGWHRPGSRFHGVVPRSIRHALANSRACVGVPDACRTEARKLINGSRYQFL